MSLAKKLVIICAVLLVCGVVAAGATVKIVLGHDRIVNGVYVRQLELGSLTKEQAYSALKSMGQEVGHQQVSIVLPGKTESATLAELGVKIDLEKTVARAYAIGREGSLLHQYQTRKQIAKKGQKIGLDVTVDNQVLDRKLVELTKPLAKKPINAVLRITPDDRVEIVPGQKGLTVNTQGVSTELARVVKEEADHRLEVAMKEVDPEQDTADIEAMGIKAIVSQFSTHFDASQANRSYNIIVAAEALNGLVVKPGEEVSFNRIVGPRSSEAGYREAPVIVNNKLVPGIGGGVCQVSTTLYNSLLKGNFVITSRRPHSHPSTYVPVGRDATVTYGGIDFKFKNNRLTSIYIKTEIVGGTLRFKIFGNPTESKEVELIDRIEQVIPNKTVVVKDPNLAQGKRVVKDKGYTGYRTTTVRLIKENGKVLTREVVARSYYKPVDRIVAEGTGRPAAMHPIPTTPAAPTTGKPKPGGAEPANEPGEVIPPATPTIPEEPPLEDPAQNQDY